MKTLVLKNIWLVLLLIFFSCQGQTTADPARSNSKIVGGGCDGCELMNIGMPENIKSTDTSRGWYENGQKLILTGTVFQLDGKTPAPDVIVYYWQTDNKGYYSPTSEMDEQAKRHGHIRGWIKTGADGKYSINTIRPAPYPGEQIPAHIHLSIKEPGIADEYYTDDINFDDDKLLIQQFKNYPPENRGGSGVVRVLLKDSVQVAEHDIILGLNIPDYPTKFTGQKQSGLHIGEDQPSFIPYHAFGPDKGTRTCPVCKYGRYHGIIYFVGNNPDWTEVKKWLVFLDQESVKRQQYLKVYFVYGEEKNYDKEERQKYLAQLGADLNIQYMALTFVPSFTHEESEAHLNKINDTVENTFIIYRHRRIVDKYIDLKPTAKNFNLISSTLENTKGAYFDLAEPKHQ